MGELYNSLFGVLEPVFLYSFVIGAAMLLAALIIGLILRFSARNPVKHFDKIEPKEKTDLEKAEEAVEKEDKGKKEQDNSENFQENTLKPVEK